MWRQDLHVAFLGMGGNIPQNDDRKECRTLFLYRYRAESDIWINCRPGLGPIKWPQKLTEGVRTLSPERITCFPSSKGLNREDFVQWTTRLFFRLRCSCLRALACVCLMASAAPNTEAKATINDTCCDMLLSERKHPTLAGVPSRRGRPRSSRVVLCEECVV